MPLPRDTPGHEAEGREQADSRMILRRRPRGLQRTPAALALSSDIRLPTSKQSISSPR